MARTPSPRYERALRWAKRVVALGALVVVAWIAVTAFPMLVHGQPTYVILLAITVVVAVAAGITAWRKRRRPPRRRVWRSIALVGAVVWIVLIGWLAPSVAHEPALAAMDSGNGVTVTESASEIVLTPTGTKDATGLFFQPGAKVDARAYVAILRPVAEAGHTVVIPKQPLTIAFLSIGSFTADRDSVPGVTSWVVGGHSLGGTMASMTADSYCGQGSHPVTGLLLFASYPASDISAMKCRVLSISASHDGLATPALIASNKKLLPATTTYDVIQGAVHAFFADYGTHSGDGTPSIFHDDARAQISKLAVAFLKAQG